MPEYEHACTNPECKHEWEDEYSIKQDPPKICPKCNQETDVRLISLGGKGVVELYGQDLVDKVKADTKQFKKEIYSDANKYANAIGEAKYNQLQTQLDRRNK